MKMIEANDQDESENVDPDLRQRTANGNEETDSELATWFEGNVIGSTHLAYSQAYEAQAYVDQAYEAQAYDAQAYEGQGEPKLHQDLETPDMSKLHQDSKSQDTLKLHMEEDLIVYALKLSDPVIIGEVNMIAEAYLIDDHEDPLQY